MFFKILSVFPYIRPGTRLRGMAINEYFILNELGLQRERQHSDPFRSYMLPYSGSQNKV